MSTEDELNEELGSYGYKLETFVLHDSNYQVRRLDGHGGPVKAFNDAEDVRRFLDHLAESDNLWCIHLDHGNVDVDRKTGEKKVDVAARAATQPGSAVVPLGIKVPVATLNPGSYRVELRALDSVGNSAKPRTADFEVE